MIYTQPYTPGVTFVLFLLPILLFTHRLVHISPNEAQTDTQSQSSVVISFSVYASQFHSFMEVAPTCPLFKLLGLLTHIKVSHVSLLNTHAPCLPPPPAHILTQQWHYITVSIAHFFLGNIYELKLCLNKMKRCTAEGHSMHAALNRGMILKSRHDAKGSLSEVA